jgi:hypothetical protein
MPTVPRDLPVVIAGAGIKTPFGIYLPPGGKVAAYVRSTGPQDQDDSAIKYNLVTTLAAGISRARSGQGDTVIVLPGHSESGVGTTMMSDLRAGTKIIGVGQGSAMPTFRWTATTDQWAIAAADVQISGLRLKIEGANGVVKGILATGANLLFSSNEVQVASSAALKATIAMELGAGSDGAVIRDNFWYGTNTHNVTDGLKVVSAIDRLRILYNVMDFSATAANGNIHITAAATKLQIAGNVLQNDHTASTACIAIDAVAATGMIWDNYVATINNGVATAQGITLGAGCLVRCFQDFSSDEALKSGILTPAVVAT